MYRFNNYKNNNYKKTNNSIFNKRILLFNIFIIVFFFIIFLKLFYMQVIKFNSYNKKSYNNCTNVVNLFPKRGIIFDRNGVIIAENKTFFNFKIFKSNNCDYNKLIEKIKKLIFLEDDDIKEIEKLKDENFKKKYIKFKKDYEEKDILNFLVNKYFFPNVKIIKKYIRNYPFNNSSSHVIGYISRISDKDINFFKKNNLLNNYYRYKYIGKCGIEKKCEKNLKGKNGFKEIEINNIGKKIRLKNIILPKNGNDIYLSIDIKLSKYILSIVKKSKASIIVANCRNGNILSMISNPSYDLNLFLKKNNNKEIKQLLNDSFSPMLNRSTQGIYPPASTIKPYIALYSLKNKFIDEDFLLFDNKYWSTPFTNKFYRDWKKDGRGWIDIFKAIEESSDIYFYNLSYQLGIDKIYDYMKNFGYGKKTEIGIEESSGILPNKKWKIKTKKDKKWYVGDTISVGIGQGYFSATPIQMMNSLSILSNNGYSKKMNIIKKIYDFELDNFINLKKNEYKEFVKIDEKYWKIVKEGMYRVVNSEDGTAFGDLNTFKYKVGGKTGTAQLFQMDKYNIKNSKYAPQHLKDHKLLISFSPFINPKFSIVIVLENGGLDNINCSYITRKILDYLLLNKYFD